MEQVTDKTRKLGLVVIRGTQVSLVSPEEGMEEIANPFVQQTGE
jgi:U6 snRNA-associated Sm-like protein LSm7